jgi:phytol kinase
MNLIFTIVLVGLVLVVAEVLWKKKMLRGEKARKFVHITVGSFVAFWPYFLSWQQIEILSFLGFMGVLLVAQTNLFHVGRDIKRRSYGELFFPLAVGMGALLQPAPIVFAAAMLHLSLADGFAALVGREYGLLHQYRVGHYTKTLAGSLTFCLSSVTIIVCTVLLSQQGLSVALLPLIIWLPLAATILENLSPMGLDNLLVPLLIIVVLQRVGIS